MDEKILKILMPKRRHFIELEKSLFATLVSLNLSAQCFYINLRNAGI